MFRRKAKCPKHGLIIDGGGVPIGMPDQACDIAVSGMAGVPVERLCSWVLVSWIHAGNGDHHLGLNSPQIKTRDSDYEFVAKLLEQAAAGARHLAEVGSA